MIRLADSNQRYLPQLADALERHELAENWATDGALRLACRAVLGEDEAREILDTDPAWQLADSNWCKRP